MSEKELEKKRKEEGRLEIINAKSLLKESALKKSKGAEEVQ